MVTLASSSSRQQHPEQDPQRKSDNRLGEIQLLLLQKLQTSLEVEEVLRIFFEACRDVVGLASMEYEHDRPHMRCFYGETRAHSAQYSVSTAERSLGSLTFTRDRRFAEAELVALEILIGSLYHPLRNALLYRQVVESSMRDPLTGIGNRSAMEVALKRELELARRFDRTLTLMLVDADNFKRINDTLGHHTGDLVLQEMVRIMVDSLRRTDEIFRYGGEEFVVLLNNTSSQAAMMVAERLRRALSQEPLHLEGEPLSISVSVGLSTNRAADLDNDLFKRADQALYEAKNAGRNRVISGDHFEKAKTPVS